MTTQEMLDLLQENLGEPVGMFYNISTRLSRLNKAQEEMVRATQALTARTHLPYSSTEGAEIPSDFLDFARTPTKVNLGASSYVVNAMSLADVQNYYDPDDSFSFGLPYSISIEGTKFVVTPSSGVTSVDLAYTKRPNALVREEDLPFDGNPLYQDFAWGIIAHAAAGIIRPRNPELAQVWDREYATQLADMRRAINSSAQDGGTFIRPRGYR